MNRPWRFQLGGFWPCRRARKFLAEVLVAGFLMVSVVAADFM